MGSGRVGVGDGIKRTKRAKDRREKGSRVQELCESRGSRPMLSAANSLYSNKYGLCGREATLT